MTNQAQLNRNHVIELARQLIQQSPLYLDTETTGLDNDAEIVEIVVLESDGSLLFESLVKPSLAIPASASALHGITNEMVAAAPSWPVLWTRLRPLFSQRLIAIYNAEFDLRMMRQSMVRYNLPWRESLNTVDIMQIFSEYRGEWDPKWRSLRRFKLQDAGRLFNIPIPNSHRAGEDSRLARAVLHAIAGLPY